MGRRCEHIYEISEWGNTENEIKREISERTLNESGGQEMAIYTDGSAESGWRNGGAACVTRWNGRDIVRRIAGGKMCSSFGAEALVMREAMKAIECERPNSVMIYTDSQSHACNGCSKYECCS